MVAAALPAGEATLELVAPEHLHDVLWATGIGTVWFLGVLALVTCGITATAKVQVVLTLLKRKPSSVYLFPRPIGDPGRAKAVKAARQAEENDFDLEIVEELRKRYRELVAMELDARARAEAVLSLLRLARFKRIKQTARCRLPGFPRSA
jgi:hypothetical protein